MNHSIRIFSLLFCIGLLNPLYAMLSVKVVAIDYKKEYVTVLLPTHYAILEVSLVPEEDEVQVRKGEFYEARILTGQIGTTKRSLLRVDVTRFRKATFRIKVVKFLEY